MDIISACEYVWANCKEAAKWILKRFGIDIQAPLSEAEKRNHEEAVEWILKRFDIDVKDIVKMLLGCSQDTSWMFW